MTTDLTEEDERATSALSPAEARAAEGGEEYFRVLLEASGDVVVVTAPATVVYASPALEAVLGFTPDEVVGTNIYDDVHPDDLADVRVKVEQLLREPGGKVRLRNRRRHKDGSYRMLEGTSCNLLEDPRVRGIVNAYNDVTERDRVRDDLQRSGEDLRASERRYRRIVETTLEGVWLIDRDGVTTFVNQRFAEMMGSDVESLLGRAFDEFLDEEIREKARASMDRRRRGDAEIHEARLRRADGTWIWVSMSTSPVTNERGEFEGALAMVTDITERRRADDLRARLAAIVASSNDAIVSGTQGGTIVSWNHGAERLFGWTAEEALGQSVRILAAPGYEEEMMSGGTAAMRGEHVVHEHTRRVRKDGTIVDVAVKVSPIVDATGVVIGVSAITQDISARTRAEQSERALKEAEEQLRQAQKLEALGRLAGGVAHDFNNILSVILGYTSLLLDDFAEGEPVRQDIGEIHEAGLRARELTRQLLAFSRHQMLRPTRLDINAILQRLERLLGRVLGEDIELSIHAGPDLAAVTCDPGQIEQVLVNLAVNAREAMPSGGRLTVETSNVEIAPNVAGPMDVPPGPYVRLTATDTGVGMNEVTRARVFDPFFTTKESGTGLGLATVFGIVKQSGGHIWVDSAEGRGTTFALILPQSGDAPVAPEPEIAAPALPRGTETILLVEDDTQVRQITCNILRRSGYRVLDASNAGEALLLFEQNASGIDLLLTDVVMPRMGGHQLAERLRGLRPDLRVLYMSGYTDDTVLHHGVRVGQLAFVQKPVTVQTLTQKVRETLDA